MLGKRVLIVEDELTQLALLEGVITRAGYDVEKAMSGSEAIKRLNTSPAPHIDIMLLDLVMPGKSGIEVLGEIRPKFPNLPVIMLTAHSSINTVVDAMRAGANDFIVKPASAERIRSAMEASLKTTALVGEIGPMQESIGPLSFDNLVGDSPAMQRATKLAQKAAKASIPVLIEGESGVGKEVFARAIHDASDRSGKPFVAVNCGAIPENLVESILFGHEKGAFTGATEKRLGKFQEANGGTLFLDEVGELPLDIQVKLLRALQEKEIDPVGGKQSIKVDIRVVSATNRNLVERISEGAFREDLFYRLNVYPILLPPLRERKSDIPALTDHFLEKISSMEGLDQRRISATALAAVSAYDWPGNIRQLQNMLFRAVILSEGDVLTPDDFPSLFADTQQNYVPEVNIAQPAHYAPAPQMIPQSGQTGATLFLHTEDGHMKSLEELEAAIIAAALERYDGRMAEIARRLKIGRSTLYRKVAEYGLDK
ncbi:sigma-54 dependent transcriptional regulator [Kordiimonas sp. 5E331]|nr:sigma-54 dependent transcriptional regulator [Kordiimonas laminariae]MCK0068363.1 sigma-54 dependent transcriptional regulator [Kordiimonas laminariae]